MRRDGTIAHPASQGRPSGDYVLLDTRRCVAVLCVCLISIIPFWTGLCVASINIGNDGAKIGSVSFGEDIRISYGANRVDPQFSILEIGHSGVVDDVCSASTYSGVDRRTEQVAAFIFHDINAVYWSIGEVFPKIYSVLEPDISRWRTPSVLDFSNVGRSVSNFGEINLVLKDGQPRTFRPFHRFVHHAPLLTGNNRLQYRGNSYNPSKPSNQRILAWAVTFGFSVYCWERGICNHASGFRWRGVFWIGLGILGAVLLSGLILLERWWDIFRHLTDLTLAFWGISWG